MVGLRGNWTRSIRWKVMVSSRRLGGGRLVWGFGIWREEREREEKHGGGKREEEYIHELKTDISQIESFRSI